VVRWVCWRRCGVLEGEGLAVQGAGPGAGGCGEGGGVVGPGGVLGGFEVVAGCLLDAFGQAQDVGAGLVARLGGEGFAGGEEFFDEAEAAGAEEGAEQDAAFGCVGAQELGELVLREQDDLAELLPGQAQEGLDLFSGFLVGLDDAFPLAVSVFVEDPLVQVGFGLLVDQFCAVAQVGSLLGGDSADLQALAGEGYFQGHFAPQVGGRVIAAQPHVAFVRRQAVEGEADGGEQGALAGAGVAVQEEQAVGGQGVEVDGVLAGEGAEGLQAQGVQTHVRRFPSPGRARACRRRPLGGGLPLRWWVGRRARR